MTDDARLTEFPPYALRDYAFIADGMRGALCGPRGDICWLCAPRWDSDAVCSTLVGGAGVYAVTPTTRFVWGGGYEPGTLIWRHQWTTTDSIIECRDALAYPGDADRLILLRQIRATESDARLRVVLDLRDGFGRRSLRDLRRHANGSWTGRTGGLRVRWVGAEAATVAPDGGLELALVVPAGQTYDLVLEVASHALPAD